MRPRRIYKKNCKYCNKEFIKKSRFSLKQWDSQVFCSSECGHISKQKRFKITCLKCGKDFCVLNYRIKTAQWCSMECRRKEFSVDKSTGYARKTIGKTNRGYHRIVMERFLGRSLLKNEHVHHINKDKLDNRIENLKVISASEHTIMHHTGLRFKDGYKKRLIT